MPHAGLQAVVGQAGDDDCAVTLWPASVQVNGAPLKRTAKTASYVCGKKVLGCPRPTGAGEKPLSAPMGCPRGSAPGDV